MSNEKASSIIGFRVEPRVKRKLQEVAAKRGQSLSDFVLELIGSGWDIVKQEGGVTQEPGEDG